MKKLILAIALLSQLNSKAQNAITTYTLTPYSSPTTSVNVSCALRNSKGTITDYPVNTIYPYFTSDSQKVQFLNIQDRSVSVMSVPDSIIHFYTTGQHFLTLFSLDSFFHAKMLK